MKPVLVTGATGFLGWHIARRLLDRGEKVRLLVRDPSGGATALGELQGSEIARGDLRDADSVARAVSGCGIVYHAAADYRLWAPRPEEMYRSNVDGTRNVLEAAKKCGVERCVYTSTVGCIGMPEGGIGDESVPVGLDAMAGPYKRSKYLAEQVALEYAKDGFPVVIVNPTAPMGDHDFKPTPTGQIVVDFLRGAIPAFIDTGLNVVSVKDVAIGQLLACERGRSGERYILGSENLTLRRILHDLAEISGRKAPTVELPYFVAWMAGAAGTALSRITGKPPRVPLDAVRMAKQKVWVSHETAARELGYAPRPAREALVDAVRWFESRGPGWTSALI